MELGRLVDRRHTQPCFSVLTDRRRSAGAPAQSPASLFMFSTFTCG
jgi:hypothetical protein